MPGGDPLLESIAHQEVVPLGQGQELLQGLGSHIGGHGDGLNALSGQVGELPLDINAEMMSCSIIDEALIEESEEPASILGRKARISLAVIGGWLPQRHFQRDCGNRRRLGQ